MSLARRPFDGRGDSGRFSQVEDASSRSAECPRSQKLCHSGKSGAGGRMSAIVFRAWDRMMRPTPHAVRPTSTRPYRNSAAGAATMRATITHKGNARKHSFISTSRQFKCPPLELGLVTLPDWVAEGTLHGFHVGTEQLTLPITRNNTSRCSAYYAQGAVSLRP